MNGKFIAVNVSERARIAVIREARGRRRHEAEVGDLAQAMAFVGIGKSQVNKLCRDTDARVRTSCTGANSGQPVVAP